MHQLYVPMDIRGHQLLPVMYNNAWPHTSFERRLDMMLCPCTCAEVREQTAGDQDNPLAPRSTPCVAKHNPSATSVVGAPAPTSRCASLAHPQPCGVELSICSISCVRCQPRLCCCQGPGQSTCWHVSHRPVGQTATIV